MRIVIGTTVPVSHLAIYNGSASTAALTIKMLAGSGAQLNAPGGFFQQITQIQSLPATKTSVNEWVGTGGIPAQNDSTIPASMRIVSSVSVAVTLPHRVSVPEYWFIDCDQLQP